MDNQLSSYPKNGQIRSDPARQKFIDEANKEGLKDAAKEYVKKVAENTRKFNLIISKSNHVLFKTKSVFPFALFPDKITIDPLKVNVITKEFFSSFNVHCIYVKNILDVFLDEGPFFSTLKIVDQSFADNTVSVPYLRKADAAKARKIIQGLILMHQQNVDVSNISDDHMVEKLEQLGTA
ncbi:MAG TPA: hypothetical protein VG965_06135 [Patescibacteria group bacterium]|nr:hypothetical protein [Patescibacteria group bacterium]